LTTSPQPPPNDQAAESHPLPLAKHVSRLLATHDPNALDSAQRLRASLSGHACFLANDLVRCLQQYDFDGAQAALDSVMLTLEQGSQEGTCEQQL
jgi:hypothetical protein